MTGNNENNVELANIDSPLGDGSETICNMFYGALPIHFELAKQLRNYPTEAESLLWDNLKCIEGIRFKRQHPVLYFIADFYCHKAKLIIEVDGGYHIIPEQYLYDKNRDNELTELGLKVIRFTNKEVLSNIDSVLSIIKKEISKRTVKEE